MLRSLEATLKQNLDREQLSGVLRISSEAALKGNMIAPSLSGFRQQYPGIKIDLTVRTGRSLDIEDYDLTIFGTRVGADLDVIARPVLQADVILVASTAYIERRGMPTSLQDLLHHDCVYTRREEDERFRGWRLWQSDAPDNVVELQIEPVLVANHTDTLLKTTLDGIGIASMSAKIVEPYLANGSMVRVLAPLITAQLIMYVGLPSRKFIPQRVQAYLDYLMDFVKQQN
ncbi:hypothetical protein AAEX37_02563 [Oligella sp. MSHR50489EDL]|uniref:substrate binding domain-containing protein n=1 Tax=Oligella sp. MSHR50489EDL TaxID=3139409 RepID=UPI003D815673